MAHKYLEKLVLPAYLELIKEKRLCPLEEQSLF
jgi:hypothetical protein